MNEDKRTVEAYLDDLKKAMNGTTLDITRLALISWYRHWITRGVIKPDDRCKQALEKIEYELNKV